MLYQNKNNEIYYFTELDEVNGFIPKEMTKLTEKQLQAYENKPEFGVWNGNEWITDNEKIENARIENINSYTQSFITKKYPLEKQSSANLGIYGDEYKTEMISFISNCITLSNEAIANNTSFEDYKVMLDEL
ncbi:hypothetical protein NG752_00825 [Aliarcobacter cryaerophilus]|uniref:hypothetical protein n=1 Tax=Aliarcobacter cryaerophilus TaxID=28198 RepID=UPI003DA56A1E